MITNQDKEEREHYQVYKWHWLDKVAKDIYKIQNQFARLGKWAETNRIKFNLHMHSFSFMKQKLELDSLLKGMKKFSKTLGM